MVQKIKYDLITSMKMENLKVFKSNKFIITTSVLKLEKNRIMPNLRNYKTYVTLI